MSTYTDIGLTVPDSFQVNEGGIIVHGSAVHVESPLGKSWSFSVQEADRLILHRPKGRSFENVLLDAQGQTLDRKSVV